MSTVIEVKVPNIGDFSSVEIIEVHVAAGDAIAVDAPLITLESDKAAMDVPATRAGTVQAIKVKVGDSVSEGDVILSLVLADEAAAAPSAAEPGSTRAAPAHTPAAPTEGDGLHCDVVVLGSGPGGYTAAFRAADLGLKTVMIERFDTLGGVCLNVGCIPSKALLHAAKVISESREMSEFGIEFAAPGIDIDKLRSWKESVVGKLTGGLKQLAKQRKVQVVNGYGRFRSAHEIEVEGPDGHTRVHFQNAIIAAGSEPVKIPGWPWDDPRLIHSTGALALDAVPGRFLVVGGGIIGLEMATVYHEFGSEVSIVELQDQIIPGCDPQLVRPLFNRIRKQYADIWLKTSVDRIEARDDGLWVHFSGAKAPEEPRRFDKVLVAVGRTPNGTRIGCEQAGVQVGERGFINVDSQMRTNVGHIFAIGDIVGQPMLAHKAVHEGKVAAEVCAGEKSGFDASVIPSVAYTDPEVAWVGVSEPEAKEKGINYGVGAFPWAASGRSLSLGRSEGLTKLIFDEDSKRVIGAGIVGPNAGDLIAEVVVAIEMGCDAEDIGLSIHPHPTLSETVAMAAEAFEGTITDLYMPKKK
ncbi:MAG: dihydrolipoyl dehydrogenase [Gammaproteobacteria bacterium]